LFEFLFDELIAVHGFPFVKMIIKTTQIILPLS